MAHILLVEDDEDMSSLLTHVLKQAGHEVMAVSNGKEALERATSADNGAMPALIVTDVMMPDMDGYSLALHLRAEEKTRGIPLVVLTSKPKMRDLMADLPNVAKVIEKPFSPHVVTQAIQAILDKK